MTQHCRHDNTRISFDSLYLALTFTTCSDRIRCFELFPLGLHSLLIVIMSFGQPPTGGAGGTVDPELQHFLEVASQKARFTANVHQFMDACWDKCIDKVPTSMDSRTQRCFTGCVDRFMDVSNMVVNQLSNKANAHQ